MATTENARQRPARLVVQGGDAPAASPLVGVPLAALREQGAWQGDLSGTLLVDEESGSAVAAQVSADGTALEWIVPGTLAPGARRRFARVERPGDVPPLPEGQGVAVEQRMDRLVFTVGGRERARYTFLGARRPYWWPLIGPAGTSVVRGQGSEDHPHHTGLTLAYGGHGEGGSTNIWSDWDEGPYGPCGRLVHRGFRYVGGGPVIAEAVEDLTYLNVEGEPFCAEVRRQRLWAGAGGALFLDLTATLDVPRDPGARPFLLAARLPGSMDLRGTAGTVSSEGPRREGEYPAARWVDASGSVGGARNGLALLDHPSNPGFPGVLYKCAVMEQVTQTHYPPSGGHAGSAGPFTLRWRVYVHAGGAQEARVEEHWAAYAGVTAGLEA